MSKLMSSNVVTVPDDGPGTSASLTADILLAHLNELRPWLRDQQWEAERQRQIPQETVERLNSTGIYALTTPRRFGGADFSARALFSLYEALGRGCGATAWTVWASTGGNLWSEAFPDDVMREVYGAPWVGNRTCAVGGSTRRLAGTARKVADGWMVSGAWAFATGSAHASHAYLAVYYDDIDDSKVGMVLVPKEQYTRRDDWDVIGLAGTGSATISIDEEIFVPDARYSSPEILMKRIHERRKQGTGPRPGGLGRSIMVGAGNAVGMAEYALELFLDGIAKKPIAYSQYRRQQDAPITHINAGSVRLQIDAARRIAEAALDHIDQLDKVAGMATPADIVRYHADGAFVWDACATAIETLFKVSGASGILRKQPLQLIARNCRTGSLHAAHNIQTCMENYGRQLCGVDVQVTSTSVLERANVAI